MQKGDIDKLHADSCASHMAKDDRPIGRMSGLRIKPIGCLIVDSPSSSQRYERPGITIGARKSSALEFHRPVCKDNP